MPRKKRDYSETARLTPDEKKRIQVMREIQRRWGNGEQYKEEQMQEKVVKLVSLSPSERRRIQKDYGCSFPKHIKVKVLEPQKTPDRRGYAFR